MLEYWTLRSSYIRRYALNLTTTSSGKLLETDGMIYFNATSNGEQLAINKENPIANPNSWKKPGMMALQRRNLEMRMKHGLDWAETIGQLSCFCWHPISLDFLPQVFQIEVDKDNASETTKQQHNTWQIVCIITFPFIIEMI